MLAIKLRRIGKKGQPSYRMVVMEKRSKLQGRFLEDLGWLEPKTDASSVNAERAQYWMKMGAQPTDTVYNLLVSKGALQGKKRPVHAKSKKKVEGEAKITPEAAPEAQPAAA